MSKTNKQDPTPAPVVYAIVPRFIDSVLLSYDAQGKEVRIELDERLSQEKLGELYSKGYEGVYIP